MAKIDPEKLDIVPLTPFLDRIERDRILHGLFVSQGNKSLLAEKLGIARTTLDQKIAKYDLGPLIGVK